MTLAFGYIKRSKADEYAQQIQRDRKISQNRINITVSTDNSVSFRNDSTASNLHSRAVSSDVPVTIDEEPSSDESSNSDSDTSTIAL